MQRCSNATITLRSVEITIPPPPPNTTDAKAAEVASAENVLAINLFAFADDVTVADIDRNKLAALVNDGTVEDTAERVMDMALEIAATPVDEAAITPVVLLAFESGIG